MKCCVIGCDMKHTKSNRGLLSFFRFPQDSCLQRKWLEAICRPDICPGDFHRICSYHFVPGEIARYGDRRVLTPFAIPFLTPELRRKVDNAFALQQGVFESLIQDLKVTSKADSRIDKSHQQVVEVVSTTDFSSQPCVFTVKDSSSFNKKGLKETSKADFRIDKSHQQVVEVVITTDSSSQPCVFTVKDSSSFNKMVCKTEVMPAHFDSQMEAEIATYEIEFEPIELNQSTIFADCQSIASCWTERLSKLPPYQRQTAIQLVNDIFDEAEKGAMYMKTNRDATKTLPISAVGCDEGHGKNQSATSSYEPEMNNERNTNLNVLEITEQTRESSPTVLLWYDGNSMDLPTEDFEIYEMKN